MIIALLFYIPMLIVFYRGYAIEITHHLIIKHTYGFACAIFNT